MAEEAKFKVTIKGPGLTFDQEVDKNNANKIMSFVMTGSALPDGGGAGGNNSSTSAARAPAAGLSGLDPKQFIAQKKPTTQYERIACLAYYLTMGRQVTEFGTTEIAAINKEAAQQPIANLRQIVNDTTSKYGYLSAAGEGVKQITAVGEDVVKALPDREAVKAAIADHRPKKKRKRAAKKKK
jgi:hypothetical protein